MEGQPVDIGQIVTSVISSIIGVFIAGQVVRWQLARAERNAAAGRPVSVPASIRAVERSRFGGIWRRGTVNIHRDRIIWTPHMPWAREFVIGGVSYGSRRSPEGPLRFLLPPAAIVVPCSRQERGYELAVLPSSVKYLFSAQIAA
jgi:hypothetical protein